MRPLSVRRRRPQGSRRFERRRRPVRSKAFEAFIELLGAYVARNGHARVKGADRVGNFCLGRAVGRWRRRYRAGDLSPERVRILERLPGWTWDPVKDRFEEGLRLLRAFARREGHGRVPWHHREGRFPLGSWVSTRRSDHSAGRLSPASTLALESVPGWCWRPREDDFREGILFLREFVRREGHARVPDRQLEAGFGLGTWVRTRRREHRTGSLAPRRARLLERLPGWRWDHWGKHFEEGLVRLEHFAKREGHACVPARHDDRGFPLGSWVNNRRAQYRRGCLPRDRVRALSALPGWKWRLRRRRAGAAVIR